MLRSTDDHQQHERWFSLTRELIQSNIADMDLDPDSLSQVDEPFTSAGTTKLSLFFYFCNINAQMIEPLLIIY